MICSDEDDALITHLQFLLTVSGNLTKKALKAQDPSEHNAEADIEAGRKNKVLKQLVFTT